MFCRKCGKEMAEGQAICTECGFKAGEGDNFCGHCGAKTQVGQKMCTECGFELKNLSGNSVGGGVPEDKKTLCGILAIFLNIGIHNFILGETKKGITKIVLTVLGITIPVAVILSWIEAYKIFTGSYEVNPDKFF